jgi:hypothetical protein
MFADSKKNMFDGTIPRVRRVEKFDPFGFE